jgi:transcriptional regulator of acetoin/glycerol metabolism
VLARFEQCRWPGNLRQLANVLRTASIMAEGAEQIEVDDLPDDFLPDCVDAADAASVQAASSGNDVDGAAAGTVRGAPARMEDWQATLIARTLARLDGNVSAAARELGLARNTVYRYLRRAGTTH